MNAIKKLTINLSNYFWYTVQKDSKLPDYIFIYAINTWRSLPRHAQNELNKWDHLYLPDLGFVVAYRDSVQEPKYIAAAKQYSEFGLNTIAKTVIKNRDESIHVLNAHQKAHYYVLKNKLRPVLNILSDRYINQQH